MLQFGSMPPELTKYNIDLFAAEVMPAAEKIWDDEGWQHHWWPERLGGVPLPANTSTRRGRALMTHAEHHHRTSDRCRRTVGSSCGSEWPETARR